VADERFAAGDDYVEAVAVYVRQKAVDGAQKILCRHVVL